jgi:hypothetical protein
MIILVSTVLLGAGSLGLAAALALLPHGSTTSSNGRDLGYQPNYAKAERLAFDAIAADLRRAPHATVFTVRWRESLWPFGSLDNEYDRHVLELDRADNRITHANGGAAGGWLKVRPEYLREVGTGSLDAVMRRHRCLIWP